MPERKGRPPQVDFTFTSRFTTPGVMRSSPFVGARSPWQFPHFWASKVSASIPAGQASTGGAGGGICTGAGGVIPLGAGVIPLGAGVIPPGAGVIPLGAGVIPLGAGVIPLGAGVIPLGAGVLG